MLSRWLFSLARSPWWGNWAGFVFTYMSFILPVQYLYKGETVLAFHHPRPAYPFHVLLVSKQPRRNLMALSPQDSLFLHELMEAVQKLVQEFHLEEKGYRLICNGGPYQDIPHLHFHLITDQT